MGKRFEPDVRLTDERKKQLQEELDRAVGSRVAALLVTLADPPQAVTVALALERVWQEWYRGAILRGDRSPAPTLWDLCGWEARLIRKDAEKVAKTRAELAWVRMHPLLVTELGAYLAQLLKRVRARSTNDLASEAVRIAAARPEE